MQDLSQLTAEMIKKIMGEQAFQIAQMSAQIQILQEHIKQLEGPAEAPPIVKQNGAAQTAVVG